jgi:uncharacterized membrane protein
MSVLTKLAVPIGLLAGIGAVGFVVVRRQVHRRQLSPVISTVTVNRPIAEVYAFYRKLDQLPLFMDYLDLVEELDNGNTRWTAKLPGGRTVSWEAEVIDDRPGEVLAWRTVEGSPIKMRGRVTFTKTPGRDMTEVRVEMELGVLRIGTSRMLARLFAKPQVKGDLFRFKQVLETGEVLRSDASLYSRPHPAQPPEPGSGLELEPQLFVENPPAAEKGVTP